VPGSRRRCGWRACGPAGPGGPDWMPITLKTGSLFHADFGSSLILSRVHWVRPELVAEVKFLTWTDDNLLRQVVYQGLREDKPASEVRRHVPHPKLAADG
jgi:ATP-dependent DNA ligase